MLPIKRTAIAICVPGRYNTKVMPVDPFRLFLPPNAIKRFGGELDAMFPGVSLYESSLEVGKPAKFVRTLGKEHKVAVEYFKGKDSGMHFFRVKGANGEIVAQSEGYGREHDAERGYMALLMAVQHDSVYLLLDTMMRGWSIHEASWDAERKEYKKDEIDCMVEAAEGNALLGYLLHLFSHWSNDIQHVANHYGLAYECIGDHKGAPITVRRMIPPAPREDAYWENGRWVEPPLTEADPDMEVKGA